MSKFLKPTKLVALFFYTILIFSIFSASFTTLVSASEIDSDESISENDDVVKNEKWIEMEKELSIMRLQNKRSLNPEAEAAYLLEKYDGATISSRKGGVSQRVQNGGWNVYYKTKNGKQTARTGYNGMFVSWSGTGTGAGAASAWATATGVGWAGGVVFGTVAVTSGYLASLAKTCRDEVDKHGNTGTARMTLTEARWSKNYDNRW